MPVPVILTSEIGAALVYTSEAPGGVATYIHLGYIMSYAQLWHLITTPVGISSFKYH